MNQSATALTVNRAVTVDVPQAKAFDIFVNGFASWWPFDHHIGAQDPETVIMEARAGGRWYERAADGSECDWGRVSEYDPPARVLLAWHLSPEFQYDPDPAKATQVEVRFVAETPTRTRVELEHRGFEVHGDRASALATGVAGQGGWGTILEGYAQATAAAA